LESFDTKNVFARLSSKRARLDLKISRVSDFKDGVELAVNFKTTSYYKMIAIILTTCLVATLGINPIKQLQFLQGTAKVAEDVWLDDWVTSDWGSPQTTDMSSAFPVNGLRCDGRNCNFIDL
jgi:hypothetical protein